ncbi:hypothetical protein C0431_05675 [bacterium]|nr:hypothetical protein [bacterium]
MGFFDVEFPNQSLIVLTRRKRDSNSIAQVVIFGLLITLGFTFITKNIVQSVLVTLMCTATPLLALLYSLSQIIQNTDVVTITTEGIAVNDSNPDPIIKTSISKSAVLINSSSGYFSITISGRRRDHKRLMLAIREVQATGIHGQVNTEPPTKAKG